MRKKDNQQHGKRLIFRWWYRHPVTGEIIRARKRPFPMWVD